MRINTLHSKNVARCNKSAWESLKIVDMNLDVNLVRCQKYLFPESHGKRLLYIGFGEGRNLVYLAKSGFECYGTEIAKKRLTAAKKRLTKERVGARLQLVDSNILAFEDNFFDIVIAWQSLYYNNRETLIESLDEIFRVLKPQGQFLSSMLSPKQKLLCHTKIAPNVFRPAKETGQQNCIIYCFKNERQIRSIYKKFKKIQIGFYSSFLFKSHNFHYVIYCEKPRARKK